MNRREQIWRTLGIALLAMAAWGAWPVQGEAVALLAPNGGEAWHFSDGGEFPGARGALNVDEAGVLHLEYDFTHGGAYVGAYRRLEPPLPLETVSFRVCKAPEAQLTVRVTDRENQTFQKSVLYNHGGWQSLRFGLDDWSGHYGGPNDGVLCPPIGQVGVLVERRGLVEPKGAIQVADMNAIWNVASRMARVLTGQYAGQYVASDFSDGGGFQPSAHSTLEGNQWHIDFGAVQSATLSHSISLLGRPEAITLKLEGGAEGASVILRLGSHFQCFERVLGALDGGVQELTVAAPPDGWRHFGGENDGEVRHPLRVVTLLVERGLAAAEPTTITLHELRCDTVVPRRETTTLLARVEARGAQNGLRTLEARCTGWNLLDKKQRGTLFMTVRDWQGRVLAHKEQPWTLPPRGHPERYTAAVDVPAALNFADAAFHFRADGLRRIETTAAYTKPLDDPGTPQLQPASPWGMGVYLYRYPDTPEGRARRERAAAMAQAAGVKWSREEFSWARMQPKKGPVDFSFYDGIVDTARRHGISVYGLLAYWAPWTDAYTEQGVDDFVAWARAVVAHYKDRIKHWEIYNEPNIFFWSGPRNLYPVLVKKCYAAIKEEDPEAEVLAISTAGVDRNFIQFCLDAGAPFDILTIHPYRPFLSERGFMGELQAATEQIGGRPVWITEMGWSTQAGAVSERAQAQLLARCYLSAILSGACQNVSWYDFRNDGEDPFYNEYNFGVTYSDLTPKPAYRALASVCRTLDNGAPKRRTDFGAQVYALEMGGAFALWTEAGPAKVRFQPQDRVPQAFNLMGDPLPLERDGAVYAVKLPARCPVFLEGGAVEGRGATMLEEPDRLDTLDF